MEFFLIRLNLGKFTHLVMNTLILMFQNCLDNSVTFFSVLFKPETTPNSFSVSVIACLKVVWVYYSQLLIRVVAIAVRHIGNTSQSLRLSGTICSDAPLQCVLLLQVPCSLKVHRRGSDLCLEPPPNCSIFALVQSLFFVH